jgi:hypothetical protein
MQQPATLALSPHQLPMIQPPLNVDVNPILEQAVLAIQRECTPDSSNDIYDNKTTEYFQYCDYCYPFDNYNKVLDANKLYRLQCRCGKRRIVATTTEKDWLCGLARVRMSWP